MGRFLCVSILNAALAFLALPLLAQTAGMTRYKSGVVEYYDGSTWRSTDNGDTGVTCSVAGSMRYNTSQSRAEFCNGTKWRSMSTGVTDSGTGSAGNTRFYNNILEFHNGANWIKTFDPPAAPAPAYVAATGKDTGFASSLNPAKPSGLAVGDLILCFVSKDNSAAVSGPAGWTYVGTFPQPSIDYPLSLLYKIADASDVAATTFTFTWSPGANVGINLVAYRNVNSTNPIGFSTAKDGTGSTATYLGGTTTYNNAVLVAYGGGYGTPGTPTGNTSRYTYSNWSVRVSDRTVPTATTIANFTGSGDSGGWQNMVVIVRGN